MAAEKGILQGFRLRAVELTRKSRPTKTGMHTGINIPQAGLYREDSFNIAVVLVRLSRSDGALQMLWLTPGSFATPIPFPLTVNTSAILLAVQTHFPC